MFEHLRGLRRRLMEGEVNESESQAERIRADGGMPGRESGTETGAGAEQPIGTERGPEVSAESEMGLSERIWGMFSSALGETEETTTQSPTELPAVAFLGHSGSFCERTFERKTGYTVDEFVVEYVDDHGGAVRQQAIVKCLPWSDSKVSRLLGDLEGEGRLVRQSMGRENAVFLPEAVPEGS